MKTPRESDGKIFYRRFRGKEAWVDAATYERHLAHNKSYLSAKRRACGIKPHTKEMVRALAKKLHTKEIINKRRMSVLALGEAHPCARVWNIVSPENVPYHFSNLRTFIEQHKNLFTEEQLIKNKRDKTRIYSSI